MAVGIGILAKIIGNATILPEVSSDDPEIEVKEWEFAVQSLVDSDNPFFEAFQDEKRINVLLLGTNTGLTDTIILACFHVEKGEIDLISVPRDTYYPREGYKGDAQKKVNAAYRGNPVNTAMAVSELLQGMPIHYYAVIDFEGIVEIVDAIGGVPVDVPFHMYYVDRSDKPPLTIDIEEGYQVLDGETAVEYLRFRKGAPGYKSYPRSDLDRMQAQQEFLKSALKQGIESDLIKTIRTVYQNVQSNIDVQTAIKLGRKCIDLTSEDISTHTLPGESQSKDPYFYFPDTEATQEMIEEVYRAVDNTDNNSDL